MWKALLATIVGFAVAGVVFVAFGLYTWTAIHSRWSDTKIALFHAASWGVPLTLGVCAGLLANWIMRL